MVQDKNLADGKASTDDIRQTLGVSDWPAWPIVIFDRPLVSIQELAVKVNKIERPYKPDTIIFGAG